MINTGLLLKMYRNWPSQLKSVEFRRNISFNNVTHKIGNIDVLSALDNTFIIGEMRASDIYICNATDNGCITKQIAITTWDYQLFTTKKYSLFDAVILSGSRIALILTQPISMDMFFNVVGTESRFAIKSFFSNEWTAVQTFAEPTSISASDRGTIVTTSYPDFVFVGPDYNGTTQLRWTALNSPTPIADAVKVSMPDKNASNEHNAVGPFFLWVMRRERNLTWESPYDLVIYKIQQKNDSNSLYVVSNEQNVDTPGDLLTWANFVMVDDGQGNLNV
jgi:hypothetical protein